MNHAIISFYWKILTCVVCVPARVCMPAHMCTWVWRTETDFGRFHSSALRLMFGARSLTEPVIHQLREAGWPVRLQDLPVWPSQYWGCRHSRRAPHWLGHLSDPSGNNLSRIPTQGFHLRRLLYLHAHQSLLCLHEHLYLYLLSSSWSFQSYFSLVSFERGRSITTMWGKLLLHDPHGSILLRMSFMKANCSSCHSVGFGLQVLLIIPLHCLSDLISL